MAEQQSAPSFRAQGHQNDGRRHVLLGSSGSVAAIKLPNLLQGLAGYQDLSIRVILTDSAAKFFTGATAEQPTLDALRRLPNVDGIYRDQDEWQPAWTRGSSILHIELRKWADIMLVAPLSAHTLAKIAGGHADNLLTSVIRAWDMTGRVDEPRGALVDRQLNTVKKIIVAPAMNTAMWLHPVTRQQLAMLESAWGSFDQGGQSSGPVFEVLWPQEKALACGDVGPGAMMEWLDILEKLTVQIYLIRLGL